MAYQWDIDNPRTYNSRMGKYRTKIEFDFICDSLTRQVSILDIGGGSGRFAIPLHDAGHDVTVIDKNGEAIELLNGRCPNIRCLVEDFEATRVSQKYDFILSIEVLDYFKDWSSVFRTIYGLLNEDGLFVFTATNKSSWRTIARNLIRDDYGYTQMSAREYLRFVEDSSFVVQRCTGFSWIPLGVGSNSRLVSVFANLERGLRLNRWIAQSPHLLFAVRKA